ncbi:MAG: hypothetical protein HY705_06495 [Gemmatimonadetes bacterium]|nr:hypothetical protein [Gemmatimonadota bacterium]
MAGRVPSLLSTIVFGLLLAVPSSAAQQRTTYVQVDYMKATSPDYEQVESSIWKPIHQERVRRGRLRAWAFYTVWFGDRTEYDYMTINVYDRLDDVGDMGSFEEIVRAAHPKKKLEDVMKTLGTRQMVRSELWVLREELEMPQATATAAPARYVHVAFMKVPPGGDEAYLKFERELWKPIHQASLGKGGHVGWGVYQLLFPGGSAQPYNYGAVNLYTEFTLPPPMAELVRAAHPGKSMEEISTRTSQAREMVRTTWWALVDATQ